MAGSRDLYVLIESLSKTEKRYCRMMLETGTGRRAHSCLRLFEILTSMRQPDEPGVRAAVDGEPFARHLAVTKNHLYEHLLRSLRTFGAARAMRSRLHGLIEGAEVLTERSLLPQATELLRDARQLAERHEFLAEQLVIERMAWRVEATEGYAGVTEADLRARRERVDALLGNIANYWDHLHALTTVARELIQGGPNGRDVNGNARGPIPDPLRELPPPSSIGALQLQLNTQRAYHMLTARYDDGYEHSLKSLEIVRSFPMDERIERFNYISVLFHHVMTAMRTGRIAEARLASDELQSLEPAGRALRAKKAQLAFCCRLELAMSDLDHERIAAMAGELEELCRRDRGGFARQMRIGYAVELAFAQFASGRPSDALHTLHPVINNHRPGFRNDMLCIARLYQLIIHFERGDTELLPYLVRSAYRFITRCRGVSGVDRSVLRFMRRLPGVATNDELIAEFRRVRAELAAVENDPAEREASSVRYILPWLDSRISGRPFREVVRERFSAGVAEACG